MVATSYADGHRTCATHDLFLQAVAEDPSLLQKRSGMEQQLQQWIASSGVRRGSSLIVTIPVVVHVLYYNANQSISDAQILSQIDVLNQDYGLLNPDTVLTPAAFKPLVADVQFQFCMASVDPAGNPTTGIERRSTTVSRIGNGNRYYQYSQGGLNVWDPNLYLNFWVCDIDGGSTLGYTYLPGTVGSSRDGVVIDWQYFGSIGTVSAPFNKGRTATHEVGHWFNLEHIWGDEPNCSIDDMVSDTPLQKGENYGCPSYPQTNQSGGRCNTTDPSSMYMNYMDYTDDACMYMFTTGQALRMQAALNTFRSGLLTSTACSSSTGTADVSLPAINVYPNPTTGLFEVTGHGLYETIEIAVADLSGRKVFQDKFSAGERAVIDLSSEASGSYVVQLHGPNGDRFAKLIKY
ncbi:MAG: hypothetical protein RL213_351 [Bacteroidota bacterium]